MKLLITGSGGFIGRNLAEYFAKTHSILAPRSRELDLCDARAVAAYFKANNPEAIIHCAVVGGVRGEADPPDTISKNLSMFDNLAEFAAGKIPLITFGSGAGFGRGRPLRRVCEAELGGVEPEDLYGLSKLEIARRCETMPNALCLNIFGCYGKYEKPSRFPTYALMQCLEGKNVEICSNALFSYLYIGDLAIIVEKFLAQLPPKRVVNAAPDEELDMLSIARAARQITNSSSKILCASPEPQKFYTADKSLLKTLLPELKFTPMRRGMESLADFLRKH